MRAEVRAVSSDGLTASGKVQYLKTSNTLVLQVSTLKFPIERLPERLLDNSSLSLGQPRNNSKYIPNSNETSRDLETEAIQFAHLSCDSLMSRVVSFSWAVRGSNFFCSQHANGLVTNTVLAKESEKLYHTSL